MTLQKSQASQNYITIGTPRNNLGTRFFVMQKSKDSWGSEYGGEDLGKHFHI